MNTYIFVAVIVGLVALILIWFGIMLTVLRQERQTLSSGQELQSATPAQMILSSGCMLLILAPVFIVLLALLEWWYAALLVLVLVSARVTGFLWRSPRRKLKIGSGIVIVLVNLSAVLTVAVLGFAGDRGAFWGMVFSAMLGIVVGAAATMIHRAAVDEAVSPGAQTEPAS